RNIHVWRSTNLPPGWDEVPAVRNDRVYAVDANAYFSRPGPRLSEGLALLAALLPPTRVRTDLASKPASVRRVTSESGTVRARPAGYIASLNLCSPSGGVLPRRSRFRAGLLRAPSPR